MMTNLPYFVSLEEALDICRQTNLAVETEIVNLDDAHGRILAQDLASLVNDPPFDNSAMDGFAVRYEDTLSPPTDLKIIATIQAAGQEDNVLVGEGEAARIMTGAPMPAGADAILQVELCETDGDKVRLLKEGMKHFIRFKGENMTEGQTALNKGAHLTPSRVGLCATMGHGNIPVVKRLKVAVISTGDELKQPGEELSRGEIYESNSFGIA
jgi:molybdopterin molybdotransferase